MLKDFFRSRSNRYVTVRTDRAEPKKKELPDGLWIKCDHCGNIMYKKEFVANLHVCEKCDFHYRIGAKQRLFQLADEGTFIECDLDVRTSDPLEFPGYEEKLLRDREKTGLDEAIITGEAKIDGCRTALGICDYGFLAGSMNAVVGEKITRLFERACDEKLPVIIVSAGGGGARMQEGILSLMQMAKTSQAVAKFAKCRQPYISVLTDPTMGGVFASFASLGDYLIAEPGALVGFAGPSIVEETIRKKLPAGFQRSEFLLEHGMIDMIVERRQLRSTLSHLLSLHVPVSTGQEVEA